MLVISRVFHRAVLVLALGCCGIVFAQPPSASVSQEEIARVRLALHELANVPADISADALAGLRGKTLGYRIDGNTVAGDLTAALCEATARVDDLADITPVATQALPIHHALLCARDVQAFKISVPVAMLLRIDIFAHEDLTQPHGHQEGKLLAAAPTADTLSRWSPDTLSTVAQQADYFFLPAGNWLSEDGTAATFLRQVRYYAGMVRAAHPQCRILISLEKPAGTAPAEAWLRALVRLQTQTPALFDGVFFSADQRALQQLVAWLRPTAARQPAACYVRRAGRILIDGDGLPVTLRGVNLGGWLNWEGWMMGGGRLADSTIQRRLRQALGEAEAERFRAAYYETFIGEDDIARIAKLGFNVVRVPINYRLLEVSRQYGMDGWSLLDRLLDWCEKYHIYVILDLHAAPGGQSSSFTADPADARLLWASPARKAETVTLWKAIARRYRDRTIVAGYDLLNEPAPPDAPALLDLDRQLIAAIRQVDPYHLLVLEGTKSAQDLSLFDESLTENQLLSFHMYAPKEENRRAQLAAFSKQCAARRMPLWNGEFGENTYPIVSGTLGQLTDSQYGVSGSCYWSWKRTPAMHPGLQIVGLSSRWFALMNWVSQPDKHPQPARADALKGAQEFLAALPLAHCREDRWMTQVLTFAR